MELFCAKHGFTIETSEKPSFWFTFLDNVICDLGGKREHHEYQLYLTLEDINHIRAKARSPQTNGLLRSTSYNTYNTCFAGRNCRQEFGGIVEPVLW